MLFFKDTGPCLYLTALVRLGDGAEQIMTTRSTTIDTWKTYRYEFLDGILVQLELFLHTSLKLDQCLFGLFELFCSCIRLSSWANASLVSSNCSSSCWPNASQISSSCCFVTNSCFGSSFIRSLMRAVRGLSSSLMSFIAQICTSMIEPTVTGTRSFSKSASSCGFV